MQSMPRGRADLLDTGSWAFKRYFTMSDDLNAMAVFVTVAEAKGFRAAGDRLGVSAAAGSQSIRKLEEQLGGVLVQRTTPSGHPPQAGEGLFCSGRTALQAGRSAR